MTTAKILISLVLTVCILNCIMAVFTTNLGYFTGYLVAILGWCYVYMGEK